VPDRLSALDASFLYLEESTTPMHVGGVATFKVPKAGLAYDDVVTLVEQRLALVPRYRQRIKHVPGYIAKPVWFDDPEFDVTFHVRRSALPRPGTDEQLRELVGRLLSRRLDPRRPMWEMYFVEGLSRNRVAMVTKTHHAMVDGSAAVDLAQVILDVARKPREVPDELWMPGPEPGAGQLVLDAIGELVRRPTDVVDSVRLALLDAKASATHVVGATLGLFAAARTAARPAPSSPLNVEIGEQRRFGTAVTNLDDYRAVRTTSGGTVNDVALATVTGALRSWLLSRGEPVGPATVVRAMVPVSVRSDEAGPESTNVSSYLVDLPVGEPSPVMRLHQVSFAMKAHVDAGRSVSADTLVRISGFAPPTLHALAAKAASGLSRRLFNLVVTNVPGPQVTLYAAGAEMLEVYPVVPLARGQALSIGLTSYNGKVFYGLNADRDAMPDIDVFCQLIQESLAELVETAA
jgi:diacylglycerol O-acyltransferase